MRPERSSPTGLLDGARDAAPLGAGGTEPAMGVAEADLGLAFCRGGAGGGCLARDALLCVAMPGGDGGTDLGVCVASDDEGTPLSRSASLM